MSQENVEIVRRVTELWNQGGWEAVIAEGLLHPDVEYHDDKNWPEARSTLGAPALIERFDEVLEVMGRDAKIEVEEFIDGGEGRVVLILQFRGEARASGIHHEYRWGYIARVRDGQVDYLHAYLDPTDALAAVGLSE